MQESFLQFVWKHQYFNTQDLHTSHGEPLQVLTPGIHNHFEGPDFKEASLKIDNIRWTGHVEVHINASDWFRHKHQDDLNYNNVVLHVVWEKDKEVLLADGSILPTLELKGLVKPEMLRRYQGMITTDSSIPCGRSLKEVKAITRLGMLERVLVSRMEEKSATFLELLNDNEQDWEEAAYQWLAKGFGFKTNADTMLELARSLPLKVLQKHRNQPEQVEALLFGQSGMLDVDVQDEYAKGLKKEYDFLRAKYGLSQQVRYNDWHFTKVRPSNYPSIRLAQLAAFIVRFPHVFRFFAEVEQINDIMDNLEVHQSHYWTSHYMIDKQSKRMIGNMSKAARENLIINTTIPFLSALATRRDQPMYRERALNLLAAIPAEKNHITDLWRKYGYNVSSAFDSQGLIQLYNGFCKSKRCVECNIGVELIRSPD